MNALLLSLVLLLSATLCAVESNHTSHPNLLWTQQELSLLRRQVETDPAIRKRFETLAASDARTGKNGNNAIVNLMRYAVLGDAKVGEAEKKALLSFAKFQMPDNKSGDPNSRNAAWREDRTHDAMRYDVLYDLLTPEERLAVEKAARYLIDWCIANPGPWSDNGPGDPGTKQVNPTALSRARTGWLPNMQWPTMIGAHVWAVALQDRAAMERIAACDGGWKWFLDHYIVDGRFYMEEFAKYYANIGGMIWWCQGCERLGMDQLGWGYVGKGGATMRRFLGSLQDAGLPVVRSSDGFSISAAWMGDAGRMPIVGINPDLANWRWGGGRMNGSAAKAMQQLWWEAGHRKFPEDGFGWFLVRCLPENASTWQPSPWFPQPPIPRSVSARPSPSFAALERGFAMLRAEESSAYWESPKPAVAFQFGMYYVHYTHDCFSLLDFVANNRQIYDKVGRVGTGYAGNDPWRDHVRGQASGLVVDDLQVKYVDNGTAGCQHQRIRSDFAGVRFVAARATDLYPNTDIERALLLTDEYLLDTTWLVAPQPRVNDWHVLALASPDLGGTQWSAAEKLPFAAERQKTQDQRLAHYASASAAWIANRSVPESKPKEPMKFDLGGFLSGIQSRSCSETWSINLLCPPLSASAAPTVGVRLHVLAAAGTELSLGTPPNVTNGSAVKVIASRLAAETCFTAIHEPFANGPASASITTFGAFSSSGGDSRATTVVIAGRGFTDRVVIHGRDLVGQVATHQDGPLSLTTTEYAWVRIAENRLTAWGDVRSLVWKDAPPDASLSIAGKKVTGTRSGTTITWNR